MGGYSGADPDNGDQGQEAQGLEVEGEARLNFLCFLDLPEWLNNDFDLDLECSREKLLDRSEEC